MTAALRHLARNMPCQIRLPVCNHDPRTSVWCHYRMAGQCGVGMKPIDELGAIGCSACHDAVDFRVFLPDMTREQVRLAHAEGCLRTLAALVKAGGRFVVDEVEF